MLNLKVNLLTLTLKDYLNSKDSPLSSKSLLSFKPKINVIPKVGEAVKLISWESEKNLNQEYIGPLISQPGAVELDGYQSGKENTAAGVNNKTLMPY